jgi:hypothetical protein
MIRVAALIMGVLLALMQCAGAQALRGVTVLVYFTGIGCPHCAKTDPVLFKQKVRKGGLLIAEYEIYQEGVNAPLLMDYYTLFDGPPGIPAVIAGTQPGQVVSGDWPILQQIDGLIGRNRGNGVVLRGRVVPFDKLNLADLQGRPKLWYATRVAIRSVGPSRESDTIKTFLWAGAVPKGCLPLQEKRVALSDDSIEFREACSFNGWILMHD